MNLFITGDEVPGGQRKRKGKYVDADTCVADNMRPFKLSCFIRRKRRNYGEPNCISVFDADLL